MAVTTKNAFEYYATNKFDVSGTLEILSKPLKGIGPAAASLLLSIHDPQNVVYFSDELYKFLCSNGKKVSLKYSFKEYKKLHESAKDFMERIQCTPIELEKVAYVLIKEQEQYQKQSPRKDRALVSLEENPGLSIFEHEQPKYLKNHQRHPETRRSGEEKKRKRHQSPQDLCDEISREAIEPLTKAKRQRNIQRS